MRPPPTSTLFPYTTLFRSLFDQHGPLRGRNGADEEGPGVGSALAHHQYDDGMAVLRGRPERERSEEHTSELQSHSDLVCRLLLEKKKRKLVSAYARQPVYV